MRRFSVLLRKELRELITPQMLVPFAIAVLMFAMLGQILSAEGERAKERQGIGVADMDGSDASAALAAALGDAGFEVVDLGDTEPTGMTVALRERDLAIGLYVPSGFQAVIDSGERAEVETYAVVRAFSLSALGQADTLKNVIAAVGSSISDRVIAEAIPGSDPQSIKNPISFKEHAAVGPLEAEIPLESVFGLIEQQTLFIPIILFIVIIFAAQMIATTIAAEKENKTLETLLASPIGRGSLIMAKMVAAGLVALLSAVAYMIGMGYYIRGVTGGETLGGNGVDAATALGLQFEGLDWVMLGSALFLAILIALAMAVILGAFADSVKAVQSLLTPLTVLTMIPYILTMLIDIENTTPALRLLVMAIPFTHAFTAAPNLYLGNESAVLLGMAYQLLWLVALVFVASRIFASDRILTMKLDFRRKKRARVA